MNILLVQPKMNWDHPYCETPSRALLILGTIAKQAGHEIEMVHRDLEGPNEYHPDWKLYQSDLSAREADLVAITCNTFQVKDARKFTYRCQDYSRRVVIGGPHAIAWDQIKDEEVVVGPGESRWRTILGLEPSDEEPVIDYSLVDLKRFTGVSPVGAFPSVAIMASRGCPFECTFCNTPVFWGRDVRRRTPLDVLSEVLDLHHTYGVKEVFFQDDTFNLDQEWACEIFEMLISEVKGKMLFKLACRANEKFISHRFLDLASKAGVWNIFYGVESGSQYMLDRMKKHIRKDEIERAFRMTHEAHIQTQASFIIGLPGETAQTLRETAEFITSLKPSSYGMGAACPFPGTDLDREVTEAGHKKEIGYEDYQYGMVYCRTDAMDYLAIEAYRG